MENKFILSYIIIFIFLLSFIVFVFFYLRIKLKNFKKTLFDFEKYVFIIDVKRRTINLRVFGKNEEFLWKKNIKIESFLKKFEYENKNSKDFFLFLKQINELDFSTNLYKDFLSSWNYYHKNFFFYSIEKTFLGRNLFSNLIIDLYVDEEDLIYAHGSFIDFKNLNIERIFTDKNIEIIKQEKIIDTIAKEIKRKSLKKHFLINIFDENVVGHIEELDSYRHYLLYIFAIWMKSEKYENIFITDNYNVYILTNKSFYKNSYLNNRYWYEKIKIIYSEFLSDLGINAEYNTLKVVSSYEFNETVESIEKTLISFNIMQDFIRKHSLIDYTFIFDTVGKIYQYETNFNKKTAADIVYQKEFKNENYILFSINLNINLDTAINLNYFLNPKKIYQEFINQLLKICSQNKDKLYRVIIPIDRFLEIDFSKLFDLINIKVYVESFKNEEEFFKYRSYISKLQLNNKRFGLYVDNVNYAWEIVKIAKPKNLWLSNSVYKNEKFNLGVEYFFEKIKNYSIGEKIILEH